MNNRYKRFDYPAQCFNLESYTRFVKPCEKKYKTSLGNLLIVANRLDDAEKFNDLLEIINLFSGTSESIDIVYFQGNTKVASCLKKEISGKSDHITIQLLPKLVSVLPSPIADVLEDSYQLDAWLTSLNKEYKTIFSYECLPLLHYVLLKKQLGLLKCQAEIIAFQLALNDLILLSQIRRFLIPLN